MSTLLDKARERRKTFPVELPELGLTIHVREMGTRESMHSLGLYEKAQKGDPDAMVDSWKSILLNCVMDDQGQPEFNEETVTEFLELASFEMVSDMMKRIQEAIDKTVEDEVAGSGKDTAESETSS